MMNKQLLLKFFCRHLCSQITYGKFCGGNNRSDSADVAGADKYFVTRIFR